MTGDYLQIQVFSMSEEQAPEVNVGAPTFKVLLEGYIKDIVPVLPGRLTGWPANFLKRRGLARNTGLK